MPCSRRSASWRWADRTRTTDLGANLFREISVHLADARFGRLGGLCAATGRAGASRGISRRGYSGRRREGARAVRRPVWCVGLARLPNGNRGSTWASVGRRGIGVSVGRKRAAKAWGRSVRHEANTDRSVSGHVFLKASAGEGHRPALLGPYNLPRRDGVRGGPGGSGVSFLWKLVRFLPASTLHPPTSLLPPGARRQRGRGFSMAARSFGPCAPRGAPSRLPARPGVPGTTRYRVSRRSRRTSGTRVPRPPRAFRREATITARAGHRTRPRDIRARRAATRPAPGAPLPGPAMSRGHASASGGCGSAGAAAVRFRFRRAELLALNLANGR